MKDYELTILISPDLSRQEIKDLSNKVGDFIKQEEGKLEKVNEPSKRKLGYPIKNKAEAFLVSFIFSLNQEKLVNLEKKLKPENQILRHIITIKEKIKEVPIKPRKKPSINQPEKVGLKEIDKKIEEILNE